MSFGIRMTTNAFKTGLSSVLELAFLPDLALCHGIVLCERSQYQSTSTILGPASIMRRIITFCEHFPTPHYGPNRFYTASSLLCWATCKQEGMVPASFCVLRLSYWSPADSQLAGTLLSPSSPWDSPGEHVVAQTIALEVHRTVPASCRSPCHSLPLLQCNCWSLIDHGSF